VVNQLTEVKKEAKKKAVQKKSDIQKTKQEQEFAHEKMCEEIRTLKDKLTKLAN
jgi:hypothetical protein